MIGYWKSPSKRADFTTKNLQQVVMEALFPDKCLRTKDSHLEWYQRSVARLLTTEIHKTIKDDNFLFLFTFRPLWKF